jgi:two-component system chemotaxis response regulator CheY
MPPSGQIRVENRKPTRENEVKKVLIVDDSETIRQAVARALGNAGFSVVEASDGIDALERIGESEFSLVILDVNMPRLGGLDLLERLRANVKTSTLPVMMLTTEAQRSMIERAKKAGARGWLIKPVKMEHLVIAVSKLAA